MSKKRIEVGKNYSFLVEGNSGKYFKSEEDTINEDLKENCIFLRKTEDLVGGREFFLWYDSGKALLYISSYTSYDSIQGNRYSRRLEITMMPKDANLPNDLVSLLDEKNFVIIHEE